MHQSLRTLLAEVLDYTGLFPPSQLPLEQALRCYADDRGAPEASLARRFVCPAERLDELVPLVERLFTPEAPARLSAVGAEDPLTPEFLKDVRAIDRFAKTHSERATVEALELRLAADTLGKWRTDSVAEGLNVLANLLVEHNFSKIEVFLEPTRTDDWSETVEQVVAALKRHDEKRGEPDPQRIGFKLRTGGTEATAVPTVAQVARAMTACRDAGIPLKFTAGLHHPLRRFDTTLQTDTHGFINIFAAGVIAHARGAEEAAIGEILDERDPQAFTFTDDCLQWHEIKATTDEIDTARGEFVLSFSAADLEQPREGLRQLNLE